MRHIVYNQATVMATGEMVISNLLTVEAQFVREGKGKILINYDIVFWSDEARMGVRSPGGSLYGK